MGGVFSRLCGGEKAPEASKSFDKRPIGNGADSTEGRDPSSTGVENATVPEAAMLLTDQRIAISASPGRPSGQPIEDAIVSATALPPSEANEQTSDQSSNSESIQPSER